MRRPVSAFNDATVAINTTMTRIDFHSNVADKMAYACRLVRKAHAAQCRIVLLVEDKASLAALDTSLWTFSEFDFLPHVSSTDPLALQTPIIVTDNDATDYPHHQILINLSDRIPAHFARFERMFEIISSTDTDKKSGRDRYRFYQQRGYPLTHNIAEKA